MITYININVSEGNSSSDVVSRYRVSVREATQDEKNSLRQFTSASGKILK